MSVVLRSEHEMVGDEEAALEEIVRSRGFAEHQILPNIFFDAPRRTIMFMYSGWGEFAAKIYNTMNPGKYQGSDFKVEPFRTDEMRYAFITPPPPENPLECMIIAAGYRMRGGGDPVYYTVERREDGGYYLCYKRSKDVHCILKVECGTTLEENMKILMNEINRS